MPVLYNGSAIIPAPFIEYDKEAVEDESGKAISAVYNITVHGKLTADKGSPNSSGTFWTSSGYPPDENILADSRLTSIATKQRALIALFSQEGKAFEITGWDGMQLVKFNPRIKKISFADGEGKGANWTNYSEYTIIMEADAAPDDGVVTKISESWNMEPADENVLSWRLTHKLSAAGRVKYDENGDITHEGWQVAQNYVLSHMGLGFQDAMMKQDGVLNADDLAPYNFMRTVELDERNGTYGVTETWVCTNSGPAIEEFTVNVRFAAETGRTTATVEGTIKGLNTNGSFTTNNRYTNASARWATVKTLLFSRAGTAAGVTLNPTTLNKQEGDNETNGVITYTYEFDNRPAPKIPGALVSSSSVSDHAPNDVYASLAVLGRGLGPVLQGTQTVTAARREINIEAVMPTSYGTSPSAPNTNSLILSYKPGGSAVFLDGDVVNWTEETGRYTRQATWTWEA